MTDYLNSGVHYVVDQGKGITSNVIHQEGILGIIDKVWLVTVRVNTILMIGSIIMSFIAMLVATMKSKKEGFEAFTDVGDTISTNAKQAVKKWLNT